MVRPPVDVVVEALRWYAVTVYSGRVVSHSLGSTERRRLVAFRTQAAMRERGPRGASAR